jgi:hypothetical protein
MNYLAADDNDGNLNNGTPHMTAIYQSFNDQQIACQTPTVQNSGCSGTPTAAPNVTATPGANQVTLSWGAVSGASSYEVFRTEGIFNCDWGKVKIGSTTGTSFVDTGLQNGRDYSYVVIPKGSNAACFGTASACDTVKPSSGPQCSVNADCDDGLFCNGSETCNAGTCVAGSNPCVAGETCDEVNDVCVVSTCTVDDDFEGGAPSWSNDAASTCTTGAYVTGNPTNPSGGYQIVGSHSGVTSIFSASNSSAGVDDIDGGNCILSSPSWAVSSASTLSVWYWFGQRDAGDDAAGDFTLLEYSINGGSTWITLASKGDVTSNPTWLNATASIPAGSTVKLRMQCSDGAAAGDLVECGIDDFSICN